MELAAEDYRRLARLALTEDAKPTLELMSEVGADIPSLLCRLPLALCYPDGQGLRLR